MAVFEKVDLENAKVDTDDLGDILNSDSSTTVSTRLGQTVKSVAKAIGEISAYDDKGAWITSTGYVIKDLVQESSVTYICTEAHTSGTFSTDLAAGKWGLFQTQLPEVSLSAYATLASAIAGIGGVEVTLVIDKDDTLTSNLIIPANINLRWVKGNTIDGAFDLTVNGTIEAGNFKLFESALTVKEIAANYGIVPQWWGAVGNGVTDDQSAIQLALDHVRDYGSALTFPQATYVCNSAITLLRNTVGGPESYVIHGEGSTLDFSGSGLTSGDLFSLGAIAQNEAHDTGFVVVRDLRIVGPETGNPASTSTPDGTTVGLSLEFCLNTRLDNLHIRRCYKGISSGFCFHNLYSRINCDNNYIGAFIEDNSTLATWEACAFKEAHYGIVILQSSGSGAGAQISNQVFIQPRIETVEVGIHIDPQNGTGLGAKGIVFEQPYVEACTYDVLRMGIVWTFSTPNVRGNDRVRQIYNCTVRGGEWPVPYTATHKPLVFPATQKLHGCVFEFSGVSGDIVNRQTNCFYRYLTDAFVGSTSPNGEEKPGQGIVIFDGSTGTILTSSGNIDAVTGITKNATGDYTIPFLRSYAGSNDYCVAGSADNASVDSNTYAVGSVGVIVRTLAGAAVDRSRVCVTIEGVSG